MAIKIKCRKCEAKFSVKDAAAGRRVKCRECGPPIKVPVPKTDEEELLDFDAAAYGDDVSTGTQPLPRRRKKKVKSSSEPAAASGGKWNLENPVLLLVVPVAAALLVFLTMKMHYGIGGIIATVIVSVAAIVGGICSYKIFRLSEIGPKHGLLFAFVPILVPLTILYIVATEGHAAKKIFLVQVVALLTVLIVLGVSFSMVFGIRGTIVKNPGSHFVSIPSGTFTMGENNVGNEAHQVTLTKGFELGMYEVTQEQYEQVKGTSRSDFQGPQNSVENVSWDDAVEFCHKLSALPAEKSAGYVYRLPTEAEWEYACRAGTQTAYSFGDSESELGEYAWHSGFGWTTHLVGQKKPNAWGLYDMHGSVGEWCQDWHGDYPSDAVTDPTGATAGSDRVIRGGAGTYTAGLCRSAFRSWLSPSLRDSGLGFRVVRSSVK
jgi:formylglycine-generating enzyme required for sulfatase activity